MAHKTYISFKAEDIAYRDEILNMPKLDCIHKRFTTPVNSVNEDYILERIRADYLSDSTVTIHLIGEYGAENRGWREQRFIKRELQASLYDGKYNTKNGVLGVVLPDTVGRVYTGQYICWNCRGRHTGVHISDSITIREFSYNYYIPNSMCAHAEDDRYCVLATWDDFCDDPTGFVERAFEKRAAPIASKTRVRP